MVTYKINIDTQSKSEKIITAVLLRKLIEIKDKLMYNPDWLEIKPDLKEEIKNKALFTLFKEEDNNTKKKMCDVVIQLGENVFICKEKWPQLIEYILECLKLNCEGNNIIQIESGINILSGLYGHLCDLLGEFTEIIVNCFRVYFKSNEISLKTSSIRALTEILAFSDKKTIKQYNEFIYSILHTTLLCFESTNIKDENNVNLFIIFS